MKTTEMHFSQNDAHLFQAMMLTLFKKAKCANPFVLNASKIAACTAELIKRLDRHCLVGVWVKVVFFW